MADTSRGSSASAVVAHPELSINGGVVTATSLQIAQHFNKRHANVMRAIKSLLSELPAVDQLNFERITTGVPVAGATNAEGSTRSSPAYRTIRDGFMLLAMGFTGKEALGWKLAYIAAFNRMEAELQKPAYDPARTAWPRRQRHKSPRPCLTPLPPAATATGAACAICSALPTTTAASPACPMCTRWPTGKWWHLWPSWPRTSSTTTWHPQTRNWRPLPPPAPSNSPNAPRCASCALPPKSTPQPPQPPPWQHPYHPTSGTTASHCPPKLSAPCVCE